MTFQRLILCLSLVLLASGCGQLITPEPISSTRPATQTSTPTATFIPTVTARATATPRPATPEPTATPTPTATPIIHTVQRGDTLLSIAYQYEVPVQAIQEANGIIDPRSLQIEQVLVIPEPGDDGSAAPTPTPTPYPVTIQGVNFIRTPQDTLWAFGEVVNPSETTLSELVIEASLFDAEGSLLASAAAFTQLDLLVPAYSVPFAIRFEDPPSSFAQYQLTTISAAPIFGNPSYYLDLTAVETAANWVSDSSYRITGQLANIGPHNATAIKLVAVAYDTSNRIIAQRQANLDVNVLRSQARTPFELDLTLTSPDVSRYVVLAQGLRTD